MTLPELIRLSSAESTAFFDPFALHARLDFEINDRDLFAVNFPIILHEYVHYLQSVSTVYGLHRVLDWIRTGVRLASVLPPLREIRVPLRTWWKKDDCPQPLRMQMAHISERLDLNHDLEQPEIIPARAATTIGALQIADVMFRSDQESHIVAILPIGDGRAIPVGARALAEGMSASAQRMWEDEPRIDATLAQLDPEDSGWYTATRTILAKIIGSDLDIDFINAYVCDAAMMTRNPPASFIHAAAAIVDARAGSKAAVIETVREALREMVGEEIDDTRHGIAEILERLHDSVEPFAQAVSLLLSTCDQLLVRRSAEIGFPIDLLCGDMRSELKTLITDYPLPCYFSGSSFLSWHNDEVLGRLGEELLMMEHAMRILLFGTERERACPLSESSSCQAPKTILCGMAPWRIHLDAEGMICAFGSAMVTFGAVGKVIE
jgi:hypothetical protein